MFLTPHLSQSDCCTNPNKTSTSSLRLTQQPIKRNQTLTRHLSQEQLQPRLYLPQLLQRQQTQLDEHQTDNCYDGDSTIHQAYLRNHRTNPTTTRYLRWSQTDNDLTTATNQCQGQSGTTGQTGSGIQDQMLRLPRNLRWWDREKPKHTCDWTQKSYKEWWQQKQQCWAPSTHGPQNQLGLCWMYFIQYRLLPTTYSKKLVN